MYRAAEAGSPVRVEPKFPCFSMNMSLFARLTSEPKMDWSPWGWYRMVWPTTLATLWNFPSSISKRVWRMRRCTGLSPSSISGIARSLMK